LPGGIRTSRIIWEAERVTLTANEALAPAQAMEDRSATDEAVAWLRDLLAAGPMKASDVQREARQAGIGDKPLRMARERLRIRPRKRAFADGWEWALPPPDDTPNVEGSAGHFPGAAKAPMRAEEPDSEVL
jgi:putative DNA primase/helicase